MYTKRAQQLLLAVSLFILLASCGGPSKNSGPEFQQEWMPENLNVDKFRNGDEIPEIRDAAAWEAAGESKQPAWCYYENDPTNGEKYGKLYNWYAVADPRGLCPSGWHVPSDAEWTALTDYLGGNELAGMKMKSTNGWEPYEGKSGNGNNESGFSGLPGGYRYYLGF